MNFEDRIDLLSTLSQLRTVVTVFIRISAQPRISAHIE